MAFRLADRVRETSTTTGTGSYTLLGAVTGFRTFNSGISVGNSCPYVVTMGSQWEVGLGTLTGSSTLNRDLIRASSAADIAVNWTAGTKDVRLDADSSYLLSAKPVLFGPTTTTSGTVFGFTSVPSDAKKVEILFDSVSVGGTVVDMLMQIGDAGGLEVSGYIGRLVRIEADAPVAGFSYTGDFRLHDDLSSARLMHGKVVLDRVSDSVHRWELSGQLNDGVALITCIGLKTLSATLTRYQITTLQAETFDSGAISTRIWT